jgi:hypothetical protein
MPRAKKANGQADAPPAGPVALFNCKPEDIGECHLELEEIDSSIARLAQKKAATIAHYKNMGVPVDELRAAAKMADKDNPPLWFKRVLAVAAILDIIPTETEKDGQITLMPGLKVAGLNDAMKEKIAQANAYNDGFNTGLAGGSETNNKYEPGAELRVKWSLGHIDGQAQRAVKRAGKPEKPPKAAKSQQRVNNRAATQPPETQLERDEASYRGQVQYDTGAEMPADPV